MLPPLFPPTYKVTFANGEAVIEAPVGDPRPALLVSSSDRPRENPNLPNGPLKPGAIGKDGLLLEITNPSGATTAPVILCGFAVPNAFSIAMTGVYSYEGGPIGQTDLWAVTLVGRDGNPDTPDLTNQHVGATCQTRDGGMIALGAANGINLTPPARDEEIPFLQAFPPPPKWPFESLPKPRFELRTRWNRVQNEGVNSLITPLHTWQPRTWNFPAGMGAITLLGVGVAIASGTGPAAVLVHEFSVSILSIDILV